MELSVVIPAFNAQSYIAGNVSAVVTFLQGKNLDFEVIVVDDGSTDGTGPVVDALKIPQVRLLTLAANQGKFGALAAGMKSAQGRTKIFTDADLPFDLEALTYIHRLIAERNFHLVIGDRSLRGSNYGVEMNVLRRSATFLFSALVRMFVTGGLFDTQCGLKGFRGDVAENLFPLIVTRGFAGDVELLYIALKYNLEIKRIPVRLRNAAPSSVRMVSHGLTMLGNIALLKLHWVTGKYQSVALENIANQTYWQNESNSH